MYCHRRKKYKLDLRTWKKSPLETRKRWAVVGSNSSSSGLAMATSKAPGWQFPTKNTCEQTPTFSASLIPVGGISILPMMTGTDTEEVQLCHIGVKTLYGSRLYRNIPQTMKKVI